MDDEEYDPETGEPVGSPSFVQKQSEAWSCPYKFIPELVDPAYPPCCAGHLSLYNDYGYPLPPGCEPTA